MKTNTDVKTKGIINNEKRNKRHITEGTRAKKKKRSEEKRRTSDSSSLSRIGRVTDESSLCLD